MKKNLLVTLVLALVLTHALGACAPAATPTPTPRPTPTTAPPTATPPPPPPTETPEVVEPEATLRIWADDARTPILLGLADEFLAEYNVELIVGTSR